MPREDNTKLIEHFKDTDLFILRAGDALLHDSGALPFITQHNSIYRLHGHDLTFLGRPYALKAWRINWHNKQPQIVTYPDPTFLPHFKTPPIYIERPIDLSIIPKKRAANGHALTTPSSMEKKGGDLLLKHWKTKNIKLDIVSCMDRATALNAKAKCSYFIDNVNDAFKGGPYGMNSVEAFLLNKPVFSQYTHISSAVCPALSKLVHHVTIQNVQDTIESFIPDKQQLRYAKQYALRVHDPLTIAQQYIALAQHLMEKEQ